MSTIRLELSLSGSTTMENSPEKEKDDGCEGGASLSKSPSQVKENMAPQTKSLANTADKWNKYTKMLNMGIPEAGVLNKIAQDGLDPADFEALSESKRNNKAEKGPLGEIKADDSNNKYKNYKKMLEMGLPRQAVENRMAQDGLDPAGLDEGAQVSLPPQKPETDTPVAAIIIPPEYNKYKKMLKMGLPQQAVEHSILQDGLDLEVFRSSTSAELLPSVKKKKKKDNVKRKKLFWEPLDIEILDQRQQQHEVSIQHKETIWDSIPGQEGEEEGEVDMPLDLQTFNKLFTLNEDEEALNTQKKTEKKKLMPQVAILDSRRAQNACIALSRIRDRYEEIRRKISILDDSSFSTTQLQALMDYSPTQDERMMIKSFTGDVSALGPAELFMREMTKLKNPGALLRVMLFKRQFTDQTDTLQEHTSHIFAACEAVRGCRKLRIVFHGIRALGNRMNSTDVNGFTLSSLPSLVNTRGYDKKTSVMRFLIKQLSSYEHGKEALTFPEDLHVLTDALVVTPKTIERDLNRLHDELKGIGLVVAREVQAIAKEEEEKEGAREPLSPLIFTFMQNATTVLDEIRSHLHDAREAFKELVTFLGGKDSSPSPEDIFGPIHDFGLALHEEKLKYETEMIEIRREKARKRRTT